MPLERPRSVDSGVQHRNVTQCGAIFDRTATASVRERERIAIVGLEHSLVKI